MFSGCIKPSDSKETEPWNSRQIASPGKNTGVVSVPCPYSYFRWCGYLCGPWVSFVTTDEFSVRVTNIASRISVSSNQSLSSDFDLFLTLFGMTLLSKGCKLDNVQSHKSLKLSFRNTRVLRSNFVECESFFESNSPDILALCETNLNDSIDSGNFYVRVMLLKSERILLLIYLVLQFMWRLDFHLHRTYL